MRPEYMTRHLDILDPKLAASKKITVIGAGAIGSFTVLSLAKMGFTDITVYDDDVIDPENMNCQFYPISMIERKKVDALKELITDYTGVNINAIDGRVGEDSVFEGDFLICAVDNMKTRKNLFQYSWACDTLIDPRMAAEYCTMEVLRQGESTANYNATLYTDEDAVQERCTAKSTVYTSVLIAGEICKAVKDITKGESYIKSLEWDIGSGSRLAWNSMGTKL